MIKLGLNRKGQHFFEYSLLIVTVTTALYFTWVYTHRAIRARVKMVEDEISEYGEEWKRGTYPRD